jgi:redox-sensitive bicupin YhaK (pirin superfamily)
MDQVNGHVVLERDADYFLIGQEQFGVPGLVAYEVIGPFVKVQALGPLIMVHDGRFEPRHGIGHHPHRFNERLFYILEGAVDHDDALNGITGHMGTGDVGQLSEGRRGMFHQEWNNTDGPARAFILVYGTDPVPPTATFDALRDADAPRYDEGPGVATKELIGSKSSLQPRGDIRFFADSRLDPGAEVEMAFGEGEAGMVYVLEGSAEVDDTPLPFEASLLVPPAPDVRSVRVRAPEGGRIIRVISGPGHGLVVR